MPKRRITAKQRAASKRNLVKARRARQSGTPMGKTVLLYRHIPAHFAGETLRPNNRGLIHLTTKNKNSLAKLLVVGPVATYSVKVPRKSLRPDPTPLSNKSEKWFSVLTPKALRGRRVQ